jgi:hypothetical protein
MYSRFRRYSTLLIAVLLASLLAMPPAEAQVPVGSFTAGGSMNQVYTYGHAPGTALRLLSPTGDAVQAVTADVQGSFLFKGVPEGEGYRVEANGAQSQPLTVTTPDDHPDASFYEDAPDIPLEPTAQSPKGGYGYLETRDGTTLSIHVVFPMDAGDGPWPVLVTYTGYESSDPYNGLLAETFPYHQNQGYVVVGVNIRGSGCSGGAFDFFEPIQSADGYDVIETVANQPWSNGDVGMVGISYGGFSQLYVAATQPPHLRAITALSPFDDAYRSILYPGGILNDGFAVDFAKERTAMNSAYGMEFVKERVRVGDAECEKNQLLRSQNRDLIGDIYANPFATDEFAHLDLRTIVPDIQVPTYVAAQFHDEQLGGGGTSLIDRFSDDVEVQATFTNGTHVEPVGPSEYMRAMAFLDIYVAKRVPEVTDATRDKLASAMNHYFDGASAGKDNQDFMPAANPWADVPDYETARRWMDAVPPIRIRWENGGVAGKESVPVETATTHIPTWPPPSAAAEAHYLQPDGRLGSTVPDVDANVERARSSYRYDPSTKAPKTFFGENRDGMWKVNPPVTWLSAPEGDALSYLTEPFTTTEAYLGTGSVDLWLRSNATDTDLEALLTEVRPDGSEVYIQSGLLRASHRHLDEGASTELLPIHTHRQADAHPLPPGQFEPVRIPIPAFAHVVRPGSRLRLSIEAPGGNNPNWTFATLEPVQADGTPGGVVNEIGHATGLPSRLVLPRLPEADVPAVPAQVPACQVDGVTTQQPSLRNQPCRSYVAPRIPTDVTLHRARGSRDVTVSWTPPPGPEVPTGYQVQSLASGEVVDVPAGATSATLQPNLRVNQAFTVRAKYGWVFGPPADASPRMWAGIGL